LVCDDDGELQYEKPTSFVKELNDRGIIVEAHDHVGHGRSSGLRAYFPSFSVLVEDSLNHVKDLRKKYGEKLPIFLVGHSLGGTVSITLARDNPDLISGICLSSAATEPPADMFGIKGKILFNISGLLSKFVPTKEVITLPKNTRNPAEQARFDNNDLNAADVELRARVGREFIDAYKNIADHLPKITTPVLAISGELDTLVNPEANARFIDGISSEDKTKQVAAGRWHNLLVEEKREEIWTAFADWIAERC